MRPMASSRLWGRKFNLPLSRILFLLRLHRMPMLWHSRVWDWWNRHQPRVIDISSFETSCVNRSTQQTFQAGTFDSCSYGPLCSTVIGSKYLNNYNKVMNWTVVFARCGWTVSFLLSAFAYGIPLYNCTVCVSNKHCNVIQLNLCHCTIEAPDSALPELHLTLYEFESASNVIPAMLNPAPQL